MIRDSTRIVRLIFICSDEQSTSTIFVRDSDGLLLLFSSLSRLNCITMLVRGKDLCGGLRGRLILLSRSKGKVKFKGRR